MPSLIIKKGLESALPSTKVEGTLYVCTDSGKMFLDTNSTTRIQLSKYIAADGTNLGLVKGDDTGGDVTISNGKITVNRALTANKLNSNAGSSTNPVYFTNGVPVAGTYTWNASAQSGQPSGLWGINTNETNVKLYNPSNFKVSHSVTSDTATAVVYEQGTDNAARHVWFSNAANIGKMVYHDNFKYNPYTDTLTVGAMSGNAASASKLTTSAGSGTIPVFFSNGIPQVVTDINLTKSNTTDNSIKVGNNNGVTGIYATSSGQGLYDFTNNKWLIYNKDSDNTVCVTQLLHAEAGINAANQNITAKTFTGALEGNAKTASLAAEASSLTTKGVGGPNGHPVYFSNGNPVAMTNIEISDTGITDKYVKTTNGNGSVGIFASTNQGLYDFTNSKWIIYNQDSDNTIHIPETLYADSGISASGQIISAKTFSATDVNTTNVTATKVTAPTLDGNATTATTASKLANSAGSSTQPIYFSNGVPVNTTYSLNAKVDSFSGSLASGGWNTLGGKTSGSLIKVAYNNAAAAWNSGTYSSSIVFGASDTKGLLDIGYNSPVVSFGGSSAAGGTNDAPFWYFKITGKTTEAYDLSNFPLKNGTGATGKWGINISGKADTAGNADKADILNSNAGGSTQPIYFANGTPQATTYALNKTVPSTAAFTDNQVAQEVASSEVTWRSLLTSSQTMQYSTTTPTRDVTDAQNGKSVYKVSGVAVQPSTATIRATRFDVASQVVMEYDTTNKCLNFNFI